MYCCTAAGETTEGLPRRSTGAKLQLPAAPYLTTAPVGVSVV